MLNTNKNTSATVNNEQQLNDFSVKIHKGLKATIPTAHKPNYIKNTVKGSISKNKVSYAPIYTGNKEFTFVGVGSTIIAPSGKVIKITQLIIKKSSENGTIFKGEQFYIKWQTSNGLFSGGHFAKYSNIVWQVATNKKGEFLTATEGLNKDIATKLLKVVKLSPSAITNMPK